MPIIATRASAAYGAGFSRVVSTPYLGPFGSYDALASVTIGTATSTVSFAGIPSGYKHLQIRYNAKGTGSLGGYPGSSYIAFNGDTTDANYTNHRLTGNGSGGGGAVTSSASTGNRGNVILTSGTNGSWSNTSLFQVGIVDILDYSSTTKNKTIKALNGGDGNGIGFVGLYSMVWLNTSAITDISIVADPTYIINFAVNTQFALYGVK
jgi:hypothetical protein